MISQERLSLLVEYLSADEEKTSRLLQLEPEKALEKINSEGYDFTYDEIKDLGEELQEACALANANDELDVENLNNVSGGSVTLGALVGASFLIKCAYDVGKIIGKNIPW